MRNIIAFILLTLGVLNGNAQETEELKSGSEHAVALSEGPWYSSPWVWVVVGAIFILVLVAITQNGRTKRTS